MEADDAAVTQVPYETAHISEIRTPAESGPDEAEWKPIRARFGIASFGANAYMARAAGQTVIEEHSETVDSETQHEELYFVLAGAATFRVADDEIDAPAGTFVYVRDPAVRRSALARTASTTVIVFGGQPGQAFEISPWEQKYVE